MNQVEASKEEIAEMQTENATNAYKVINQPLDDSSKHVQKQDQPLNESEFPSKGLIKVVNMSDKFKKCKMETGVTIKSELNIYIEEAIQLVNLSHIFTVS